MGFLLVSGLSEFSSHFIPLLALLLVSAGFGLWIARPFTRGRAHAFLHSITLAIPLGTIAIVLQFAVFILLSRIWSPALTIGVWLTAIAGLALLITWLVPFGKAMIQEVRLLPLVVGIVAFMILLILRMAFLRDLIAPPYADSAYHYLLATRLLDPAIPLSTVTPGSYYHLGFHTLAAWLAALTRFDLMTVLPLIGQVMLAILPLSFYALALNLTEERNIARISALAAAFLWSMPALAANWGKYPAISAIALFPAICAALILVSRQNGKKALLLSSTFVLLAGMVSFHTRILVLLLFAGTAGTVSIFILKHAPSGIVRIISIVSWLGCAALYLTTPFLPLIYNGDHFLQIIGVILLLICALIFQSRLSLGIGLFTLLLMSSFYIPLPAWLPLPAQSLLDEQFLSMSLFLPFSLVIGIGASRLLHLLRHNWHKAILWLTLSAWIFVGAINHNGYIPDSCCNFVTSSDLAALDWMKTHLPPGSTVYIAGIEKTDGLIGSDAGVWVHPLTGLTAQLLPFDFAWFLPGDHAEICALPSPYLYVGGQPYSFQINAITHPEWYELVFEEPNTSIYRIVPCKP